MRDQDTWRALLTETIRDGITAGIFVTERDPELVALQVNCLTEGTVFPAFARNPAYNPEAFRAAAIDDLARLLNHTIL